MLAINVSNQIQSKVSLCENSKMQFVPYTESKQKLTNSNELNNTQIKGPIQSSNFVGLALQGTDNTVTTQSNAKIEPNTNNFLVGEGPVVQESKFNFKLVSPTKLKHKCFSGKSRK